VGRRRIVAAPDSVSDGGVLHFSPFNLPQGNERLQGVDDGSDGRSTNSKALA